MIGDAVAAAGEGDLDSLADMVSERYRDPAGHGKAELLALVRFHVRSERSLHLLEKVRSVRQTGPERIDVEMLLAAAAVPIDDLTAIDRFSGDLLFLEIAFEQESGGDWRVVEARWRRADPADLL
jgi:hypothetical protein